MRYAVIRTGGKQYRVAPGDVIGVEKLAGDVGSEVEFAEVLLATDGDNVRVGQPLLTTHRVRAQILGQEKARKVLVFKKKRRKAYRRTQGHRQLVTRVQVTDIEVAEGNDGA